MKNSDKIWMKIALDEARNSAQLGEVPVGAALILENKLLASAGNSPIISNDPSAHAEISAIRVACETIKNYRLPGSTLYVTLEPCMMCMGAIIHARIERLVFGAYDPKTGAVISCFQFGLATPLNHQIAFSGGILEDECSKLIKDFFRKKRNKSKRYP